jgi:hypothetical protein
MTGNSAVDHGRATVSVDRSSISIWIAAAVALILFSMPMLPYLAEPTDLTAHIEYAQAIHQVSDLVSPHFLFQLLIIIGSRFTGASFDAAAIALMALCYALMAGLIALRIKESTPWSKPHAVVATSVLVLIASHIFLQTAFRLNFYYGYIAPTVYHNPTQVLSKALAIAVMFVYFSLAFNRRDGWGWLVALPIGVVLSAVAKPSFLIAFVPCVCAVELYRGITGSWRAAIRNSSLVAMPACIVLALQFWMTFTGNGGGGGLALAPFLVYGGSADVLAKLPASLLFPVTAVVVLWRQAAKHKALEFAWFLYIVGMAISFCVVESGPRMMHGNFAWTGQTVTFLLYVESTIALMALPWWRAWPAWIAFGLHVMCGVVWYSAAYVFPINAFM